LFLFCFCLLVFAVILCLLYPTNTRHSKCHTGRALGLIPASFGCFLSPARGACAALWFCNAQGGESTRASTRPALAYATGCAGPLTFFVFLLPHFRCLAPCTVSMGNHPTMRITP
jgi:hypothetical protein